MSAKEVARVLNAFGACHIHQGELDDVIQDYFMMSAAETESDGRFVTSELINFGPSHGPTSTLFSHVFFVQNNPWTVWTVEISRWLLCYK